jgi:hypothetical protein
MASVRSGTVDTMRAYLAAACEAVGLAATDVVTDGEKIIVEGGGLSVEIAVTAGQPEWRIVERYTVAEPEAGWSDRREPGEAFRIGDEAACARAAALAVARHRIDAAVDAV